MPRRLLQTRRTSSHQKVAQNHSLPFHGLWLEAGSDALIERVEKRTDNASDATAAIVRQQLTYDLGTVTWTNINAPGEPDRPFGLLSA
jgi:predicted kinase